MPSLPLLPTNMSLRLCREGHGGLLKYERERRIYGAFRKILQHSESGLYRKDADFLTSVETLKRQN